MPLNHCSMGDMLIFLNYWQLRAFNVFLAFTWPNVTKSRYSFIVLSLIKVIGLMITETARSWLQSLTFLINMRTGIKARSMVWSMVYNKMSRLKNAGNKSVGEVRLINSVSDALIRCYISYILNLHPKDFIEDHISITWPLCK